MHCVKTAYMSIVGLVISLVCFPFGVISQATLPDGLGNYWHIEGKGVKKINPEGKVMANYSNILLGTPSQIDTNDPFRVLVFYNDTQTIIVLNSDGNIIGKPVQTPNLGLGEVTLVCRSNRGGAWLYHRESAELVRFDQNFSQIRQRLPIPLSSLNLQPNHLVSSGGNLYVGLENQIILKLDEYGGLLGKLETPYENIFRVEHGLITIKQGETIKRYSAKTPFSLKENFSCTCASLPLIVDNEPRCFQGKTFIPCKKNSTEP